MKRNRFLSALLLGALIVFGLLGVSFSGSDEEARKLYQGVQDAYRNFVNASVQKGTDSAEAREWLAKYQQLAAEYVKYTGADGNSQVFGVSQTPAQNAPSENGSGTNQSDYTPPQKLGIFGKVKVFFLEALRGMLDQMPSHINNFALGEMNFVTGNYKDALSLYEMAERQAALEGKFYYQAVYWQGRCYLEMAKSARTTSEKIALYEKAQQKFTTVSINLSLKTFKNNQQETYEKDATSLIIQTKSYVDMLKKQNGGTTQPNVPDVSITSGLDDNSWMTTLRYDYMISDRAYVDAKSMSRDQIQSFLQKNGSCLSRPVNGKYPADMIYESANKFGISPKVILSRLQTEQSLITTKNPTQKQLDWATGCGAYDAGNWNSKYKGLENQIYYGTMTMRNQYNRGLAKINQNGSVPMKIDGETINVKNAATYANYMYTPHKHGGQLFRGIYIKYFVNGR